MEFFAGANTRYGFKSIFDSVFADSKRLFILKGSSGCGKSTLMRRFAEEAKLKGLEYHMIYCSGDPDSIDGVIIPSLGFAICDGTAPHIAEAKYPCVRERLINLGEFWDETKLIPHREKIISLTDSKSARYKNAYRYLDSYGKIADTEREMIRGVMNGKEYTDYCFSLGEKIFGNGRDSVTKRIFSRALTASGIAPLKSFGEVGTLYRINGKAKGIMLNDIEKIAAEYGANRIISLSPTDPNRVDAIYFSETDTLITVSEEEIAEAKKEKPVYSRKFINEDRLSKIKIRLKGIERLKAEIVGEAQNELAEARSIHSRIEQIYIPAMDFTRLTQYTDKLIENIFSE